MKNLFFMFFCPEVFLSGNFGSRQFWFHGGLWVCKSESKCIFLSSPTPDLLERKVGVVDLGRLEGTFVGACNQAI